MNNITLILTSIFMGAIGQILLKFGANNLGEIKLNFSGLLSILTNYYVIGGLFLFGSSFILWVKVLTKNDLSYVYPLLSLSYIIITIASKLIFNEPLTFNKLIGITTIIIGVIIINR